MYELLFFGQNFFSSQLKNLNDDCYYEISAVG